MQPSCLNKHGQLSRKSAVANQSVGFTSLLKCVFYLRCVTHNGVGLQFKCVLTDNPPSPGEAGHITKVYAPLPFSNSGVGSFTSNKNQISESAVRWDLRFFVLIRED